MILKPKILNLGCGSKIHPKMINIDFFPLHSSVIKYNLLEPLSFKNNSIDLVYHANLLEHFDRSDGYKFLKDNYRILKKDGILRISVPNLENICREYIKILGKKKINKKKLLWIKIELLDQIARNKPGGEMSEILNKKNSLKSYIKQRIGNFKIKKEFLINKMSLNRVIKKMWTIILGSLSQNWKIGKFRSSGEVHLWMYDQFSLKEILYEIGFKKTNLVNPYKSSSKWWLDNNLDISENGFPCDPNNLFLEAKK